MFSGSKYFWRLIYFQRKVREKKFSAKLIMHRHRPLLFSFWKRSIIPGANSLKQGFSTSFYGVPQRLFPLIMCTTWLINVFNKSLINVWNYKLSALVQVLEYQEYAYCRLRNADFKFVLEDCILRSGCQVEIFKH